MILGDSLAQIVKDTTILKEVIVNVADTVTNYVYIKEVPMSDGWSTDTWVNIIGVFATLLAVGIALFKERLVNCFNGVKLSFKAGNIEGEFSNVLMSNNSQIKTFYINSKVYSKKKYIKAKNIKIKLVEFSKQINQNDFEIIKLNKDLYYFWTPIASNRICETFSEYKEFDFVSISEKDKSIFPSINIEFFKNRYGLNKKGKVRYKLLLEGDNYFKNTSIVYEVEWNGNFVKDNIEMNKNITVKVVNSMKD